MKADPDKTGVVVVASPNYKLWLCKLLPQVYQDYSKIAARLTQLTSIKVLFTWSPEA